MTITARQMLTVLMVALFLPSGVSAQGMQSPRKEGFTIGVMVTAELGVGRIVSLRAGVPAGNKAGFDFDIGYRLGRKKCSGFQTNGWVARAHARWLPRGRRDTGWGTAIITGVQVIPVTRAGRTYFYGAWDLGMGFDRLLAEGHRVGFEFANSIIFTEKEATEGIGAYISAFGLWKLR